MTIQTAVGISIGLVSLSFIWHSAHHSSIKTIWEYLDTKRKYVRNLEQRIELLEAHLLYFVNQNGGERRDQED